MYIYRIYIFPLWKGPSVLVHWDAHILRFMLVIDYISHPTAAALQAACSERSMESGPQAFQEKVEPTAFQHYREWRASFS